MPSAMSYSLSSPLTDGFAGFSLLPSGSKRLLTIEPSFDPTAESELPNSSWGQRRAMGSDCYF